MISEIEHKGIWWLPENEDRKIDGILNFNPQEGSTLDLSGSLRDMKDIMKVSKWDIILGFTVTGKEVTLLHNYSSGTQLHLPGIPTWILRQ